MSWAERITGIGILLMFLGGAAADSPGDGYLYAGAIVLVGCALAFLGQRLEAKSARKASMSISPGRWNRVQQSNKLAQRR